MARTHPLCAWTIPTGEVSHRIDCFAHPRVWIRKELASYIEDILLDPMTLRSTLVTLRTKLAIEHMVSSHIKGVRNYTDDIDSHILSCELTCRSLPIDGEIHDGILEAVVRRSREKRELGLRPQSWHNPETGRAGNKVARAVPSVGPEPRTSDVILDAGCGSGRNLSILSGRVKEVVGLDFSEEMSERAQERVQSEHLSNASLVRGTVTDIKFPDARFDKVVCASVLQYLDTADCEISFREDGQGLASHREPSCCM